MRCSCLLRPSAVCYPDLVDQIAPGHTARIAHEEQEGGGKGSGLAGAVKRDWTVRFAGRRVLTDPLD